MDDDLLNRIRGTVRTVPNFPIEGIMFRDITPVLGEPGLLSSITDRFAEDLQKLGWEPEAVVGPEARGFIFGPLLSERIGCGFVPVRKPGSYHPPRGESSTPLSTAPMPLKFTRTRFNLGKESSSSTIS